MMSSKNNGFTANDIERYHSGKMPAEERHALEKAALDDPFLADALEGYTFTASPSADLAEIRSRLAEKTGREKTIPFFRKYKWLSAAAIVLIIAGAGWLAYSISGSQTKFPGIAVQQQKDTPEGSNSQVAEPLGLTDTNKLSSGQAAQPVQSGLSQPEANAVRQNNTRARKEQNQINKQQEAVQEKKETTQMAGTQAMVQNQAYSDKSLADAETKNKGLVAQPGANKAGVPFTDRPAASNNANMSARIRSNRTGDTLKNIDVVLHPLPSDSASLQEVVVGRGTPKKSAVPYPHVIIDSLEPAEGYVKFDDYVAGNLRRPEEYKAKTLSGEVQLSFDVDKDGQPVNIAVVKSLCEKCDEEAIRLLKEGPKWKKKKNKKGKITFKF